MKVIPKTGFYIGTAEDQKWTDDIYGYSFTCPGCGRIHTVMTNPLYGNKQWEFNGDIEKPSFMPSLKCTWDYSGGTKMDKICHSFITDGKIQFCGDSTHELAGQTVELPEIE